jgi:hypothetical protein
VTNTPPKFIKKIASLVEINNLEPKIIILPQVKDEEYNKWIMKVYDSSNSKVPEFLEVQAGVLIIAPSQKHIGKHSITIDLIDEFSAKFSYQFYI